MNTEDLGNSKILNLLFKPAGVMMESRLRQWLMNPVKTLRGADIQPGLFTYVNKRNGVYNYRRC